MRKCTSQFRPLNRFASVRLSKSIVFNLNEQHISCFSCSGPINKQNMRLYAGIWFEYAVRKRDICQQISILKQRPPEFLVAILTDKVDAFWHDNSCTSTMSQMLYDIAKEKNF